MTTNVNPADGAVSALNTRSLSGADAATTLAQLRALSAQANAGGQVGTSEVSVAANGVHSAIRSLNTTIAALQSQISQSSTPALQSALTQAQASLTQVKSGVAQLNNALNTAGVSARIQVGPNGAQVNSVGTSGLGGSSSTSSTAQASALDTPPNETSNLLASGNVLDDATLAASPGLQLLKKAVQDVLAQVQSGQLNPDGSPTGNTAAAAGSTAAAATGSTAAATGSTAAASTQSTTSGSGNSGSVGGSNTAPSGGQATTQSTSSGSSSGSSTSSSSSRSGAASAALLADGKQDFANMLFQQLFQSIKKIKAQAVDQTNAAPGTTKIGGTNQLQSAGGAGAGANAAGSSGGGGGSGNVNTAGSGNTASTQSDQSASTNSGSGAGTSSMQSGGAGQATTQVGTSNGGATTQNGVSSNGVNFVQTGGDNDGTNVNIPDNVTASSANNYAPDPLLSYPNINGLLQAILLESYAGSQKDLKSAAKAMQAINDKKNGLRAQYDAAVQGGSATDPGPTKIKDALDQAGDDTQLLQISVQTATQNSSQALTTLTNFIKATNDNAQAVIHHIGGG